MDSIGITIRKLREERKLPLRTIASYLDLDQAVLSKMERGQRKFSREHVLKLAVYFQMNEKELLITWLSDNMVYHVTDEQYALQALQLAEEKLNYSATTQKTEGNQDIIHKIMKRALKYFQSQSKVSKAWLFGSYARGDYSTSSDIDIMIDVPTDQKFTLFDIAEVKDKLQKIFSKKVDVVMLNGVSEEVKGNVKNEMRLIYEAIATYK